LKQLGARNVVITGGHLPEPTDLLGQTEPDGSLKFTRYHGERVQTNNTHGTGCAFSTALACNLARGLDLVHAVQLAKDYVADALRGSYNLGKGVGPVNHFAR
jgi:hydroxymethylpyrimidine/phosphomethylpyrimidine kinase